MKKQNIIILIATIAVLFFFVGCEFTDTPGQSGDNPTGDIDEGASIFRGHVFTQDSIPLIGAKLNFDFGAADPVGVTTTDSGKYVVEIVLGAKKTVVVTASMEEYKSSAVALSADINIYIDVPNFYLEPLDGTGDSTAAVSGDAASIYLLAQSKEFIGIKEGGSDESVQMIFQVIDSTGSPIDADHKENVRFFLETSLDDQEYLFPDTVSTDEKGQVLVTLNSGYRAGVVMVVAEINRNGRLIRSKPVPISIHGGFPDLSHFAISLVSENFPFWGQIIEPNKMEIVVLVGDKYSNPVRPGTSVYFESSHGVIEGSALTDDFGMTKISFLGGNPSPPDGLLYLTAKTVDETNSEISASTVRMLSGKPVITISPTSFDIPDGGTQDFNIVVSDNLGNPLSKGQSVDFSVETTGEIETSETSFKFPDTRNKSETYFSFSIKDALPDSVISATVNLTIETKGPNGEAKTTIKGTTK